MSSSALVSFKGPLDSRVLDILIQSVEIEIRKAEENRSLAGRIIRIAIEILQNLYLHGRKPDLCNKPSKHIEFSLIQKSSTYAIRSLNHTNTAEAARIRDRIDRINGMSLEKRKDLYRKTLSNPGLSATDRAGLGFLEIARLSKNPLKYSFAPVSDDRVMYQIEVRLDKPPDKQRP